MCTPVDVGVPQRVNSVVSHGREKLGELYSTLPESQSLIFQNFARYGELEEIWISV